ncbi:threonine/serine ThrE exporter family protein [Nesterenkonia alba]|uniref:threonine/serine ThrE exporter family protein n=1 Tax=Nesterenkonia alba TaxID=515814 RepID=UPI0003B69410|nr:threonine/serine exporter family protein [Nesterenkonia alba]
MTPHSSSDENQQAAEETGTSEPPATTEPIDPVISAAPPAATLQPLVEPSAPDPATGPVPAGARRRRDVRHVFRRVMHIDSTQTGQIPIIDRLTGTPYENPYQAEEPGEADELVTINLVLDLGEALFRYGAGALEVETSIIAVSAAFGMKNTDVDITNQSIILNWAPEGKVPYTRVRVVRSWSANFRALSAVHQLVTDIIDGHLTRSEAEERLAEITRQRKPYPRWAVTLAGALFAAFFSSYTGATPLEALLGFGATLLVLVLTRQLSRRKVPEIFALAAGGFTATAVALGGIAAGLDMTPSMVVAGGLMILLPSVRIVSALQDVINAFPITAAGRLVSSLVAFAGMTAGIMVAVVLAEAVGAPQVEIAEGITRLYSAPTLALLVFCSAVSAAVVEQVPWRLLAPTGAVAVLGFCAFYTGELLGLGETFTPLIGATVIGALARVTALRFGAPQLVVAVPAMMFMLPGLLIFRGMYQLAIEDSTSLMLAGLFQQFTALIIILAIASGIVLGDVIMRPFTARWKSHERFKARRR